MNNPCTFYIVRHAKTEANANNVVSGHKETSLIEEGIKQATKRAYELQDIPFSAAFSSDLVRAKQTAEIIAAQHNLAVIATQLLRERNSGAYEGKNREMISEELRKALEKYETLSYEERKQERWIEGMETDEEIIGRFETFLRETALSYSGKTVLVVTHGNIMRTLLVHLGYGTHQELSHGTLSNTGYFVLESDGVEFEVKKTVGVYKKTVDNA